MQKCQIYIYYHYLICGLDLEDSYIPSGDLAVKTTLCYFIIQLHLHLKSVEHGEETFYNTKKFCEHFSRVKTFFPYSDVEMASMDKKIKEWTTVSCVYYTTVYTVVLQKGKF